MGDEVVSEVGSAEEETLDLVIEAQLADGHQDLNIHNSRHASDSDVMYTHRSACGPVHPIEQFLQAFIFPNPYQSVNGVFVTATKSRMTTLSSKTLITVPVGCDY